ncbi:MAG: sulfurtransferase [Hyphomicrobiaceae bacterium]|nr:sulfurtransferase [Hyphomicrobiaceae bacterium]
MLTVVATLAAVAQEVPKPDIPKIKQTKSGKYLGVKEAAALVKAEPSKVLFLDIRTRGEVQFVGYATDIDGVVPFVDMSQFGEWDDTNNRYKLETNPVFSQTVGKALARKGLNKTDKIILMCRSGDRSARAADMLEEAGYTNVYSVYEGFEGDMSPDGRRSLNGWRNAGLPWTYKGNKAKMFVAE